MDVQLLQNEDVVLGEYPVDQLVLAILSLSLDVEVELGEPTGEFLTAPGTLQLPREVPLQVFELVFRPAEELRVLDRRRVVEGRERGKTYVHASDPGFGYLRQKLSVWRFA